MDFDIDRRYGTVPDQVVDRLLAKGIVSSNDCLMLVAARSGFARPFSRAVRIMVCMDRDRGALDGIRDAVAGGCKTEFFERDWTTYVPARGRYDSAVICPSILSFDLEALRRIEMVSKRGCACIFTRFDDYADTISGKVAEQGFCQDSSDDLIAYLEGLGRMPEISSFVSSLQHSIDESVGLQSPHSVDPGAVVDRTDAPMRIGYSCDVVSWTVPPEDL